MARFVAVVAAAWRQLCVIDGVDDFGWLG
jgi:hypothetical protein